MQKKSRTYDFNAYGGWLLAGLALVLRLAYILVAKSNPTFWVPQVDSLWYHEAAQTFAHGSLGELPFFRAPLYPALLGGLYYLLGPNLIAARVLNALVQSAAVWALFRVGYTYFSPLVAWIAAGLLALNGMAIFFASEILSTSFELLAAVCALWATLRALNKPSAFTYALCGLTWGIAAIIRPNFLIVLPLVCFLLLRKRRRSWLPQLSSLIIGIALPILPVTLANLAGSGEFVLVATQGGINFWIGNNPESNGMHAVLPGFGSNWTIKDTQEIAARESGRHLRPGEVSNFYYRKAVRFITAHPLAEARLLFRKTLLFFNRFEIANNRHFPHFIGLAPWLPPLAYLNFGFLVPLAILGVWVNRRREGIHIVLGFLLFYAVSVILFFVAARFRMPVVPALCVFAALAIEWCYQAVQTRKRLRQLAPLLLLIPAIVITFMNPWHLREERRGWAYYKESYAYVQLNEPQKAEVAIRKALDDVGNYPRAYLGLEPKERQRRTLSDEALRVLSWNILGAIRESLGDTASAFAAYSRALAINPNWSAPRTNLARLYFQQGLYALYENRNEEAVFNFGKSIELLPNHAPAHYNLALALDQLGKKAGVRQALEAALAIDSTYEPAITLMKQMQASP